jgi:hypothetical protein
LVSVGVEFPKTHNIEHLVDMLPAAVRRCPELQAVGWLTVYATILRYPGAQGTPRRLRSCARPCGWPKLCLHGPRPSSAYLLPAGSDSYPVL